MYTTCPAALAVASALWLLCVVVPAQSAQRAFVSTTGNDANPCSLVAPCRSFQAAINTVTAGGEVIAVDSGGYGSFTVDKSVTVSAAPGVHAGISVGLPT